jgi:hypothetical protein
MRRFIATSATADQGTSSTFVPETIRFYDSECLQDTVSRLRTEHEMIAVWAALHVGTLIRAACGAWAMLTAQQRQDLVHSRV